MMLFDLQETPKQRDHGGRFAKGNRISKRGGHARAAALSPRRRRQIAKAGWAALVDKRFGGDERAAKAWFGALGAWVYDQQLLDIYGAIRPAFPHPGDPSDFRSQLYQTGLFDGLVREVNFYAVSWNSQPAKGE